MVNRRKVPSTRYSKRISRDVQQSTIGSHVERPSGQNRRTHAASTGSHAARRSVRSESGTYGSAATNEVSRAAQRGQLQRNQYVEAVQHRARRKRVGVGIVIVVVVVAIALLAGFLAFRGSVGSAMALRDSDAAQSLVSVKSDEPYYALVAVELGAVAEPLEHAGPDMLTLVRVDRQNNTIALVELPPGLQVSTEAGTHRIADLALKGDAALIDAVANFAKVDITHYVKVDQKGLEGIVEAFGGVEVNVDQVIDDPHAGDVYIPAGTYTLNGSSALTYLRADNLRMGVTDQLQHQVDFSALVLEKLFSTEGNFATRIDSIDEFFQTDMSLGDIEALQSMLAGVSARDITRTVLPGYLTEVTGVVNTGDALFIGSSDDMAAILAALEAGEVPDVTRSTDVQPAAPGSFTVEVQNGTNISGAAAVTTQSLAEAGFNVTKTGNAEQPVYDETLVVYKGSEGPSRAKAIIDTLGVGRAVSGDIYYSFDTDVLVIIGSDYKPFV